MVQVVLLRFDLTVDYPSLLVLGLPLHIHDVLVKLSPNVSPNAPDFLITDLDTVVTHPKFVASFGGLSFHFRDG